MAGALALLVAVGVGVGCRQSEEAAPLPGAHLAWDDVPATRYASRTPEYTNWWHEWALNEYLGAYERHGQRDPAWDDTVKDLLTDYAHRRVFQTPAEGREGQQLAADLREAMAAGCQDPLVRYLHLRVVGRPVDRATPELAKEYSEVAEALDLSQYALAIRCFANVRAAQAWRSAVTNQVPEVNLYRQQALDRLIDLVRFDDLPVHVAYEVSAALYKAIQLNPQSRPKVYLTIQPYLQHRWPDEALVHLLEGRFYIDYAWDARGGGWATSVTDEGWKLMRERLALAETALSRSWELDSTLAETPIEFMRLELGQARGRERMEEWFGRAILHPNQRYMAVYQKLWYLQPRWYGSERECLEAARGILRSDLFVGETPLHLYHLHVSLAEYFGDRRPNYWTELHVWPDIDAAFQRYFELHTSDHGWRQTYILMAHRCRQWAVVHAEIPKLTSVNYAYFGGQESFERMREEARRGVAQ
jgi:hypothetical protein